MATSVQAQVAREPRVAVKWLRQRKLDRPGHVWSGRSTDLQPCNFLGYFSACHGLMNVMLHQDGYRLGPMMQMREATPCRCPVRESGSR